MMRRTVLLVATTALALIAAGGLALATTTFTCTTDPCDGTTDDDVITGTVNAETINGKAGNDEIFARDASDTLNGEDGNDTMHGELGDDRLNGGDGSDQLFSENGTDRLNGGADDDILDGSPATEPEDVNAYYDHYLFNPDWGKDTIIDSRGRGVISVADAATASEMSNLTVDLVSHPTRPEVSDGNGNTMNWESNHVRSAHTGAGDDVISQSPKSNGLNGAAGNDTYNGYSALTPQGGFGSDTITDLGPDGTSGGTADVLDLSSWRWRAFRFLSLMRPIEGSIWFVRRSLSREKVDSRIVPRTASLIPRSRYSPTLRFWSSVTIPRGRRCSPPTSRCGYAPRRRGRGNILNSCRRVPRHERKRI